MLYLQNWWQALLGNCGILAEAKWTGERQALERTFKGTDDHVILTAVATGKRVPIQQFSTFDFSVDSMAVAADFPVAAAASAASAAGVAPGPLEMVDPVILHGVQSTAVGIAFVETLLKKLAVLCSKPDEFWEITYREQHLIFRQVSNLSNVVCSKTLAEMKEQTPEDPALLHRREAGLSRGVLTLGKRMAAELKETLELFEAKLRLEEIRKAVEQRKREEQSIRDKELASKQKAEKAISEQQRKAEEISAQKAVEAERQAHLKALAEQDQKAAQVEFEFLQIYHPMESHVPPSLHQTIQTASPTRRVNMCAENPSKSATLTASGSSTNFARST